MWARPKLVPPAFLVLAAVALDACGSKGGAQAGPPPQPEPPPAPTFPLRTAVGLDPFAYQVPALSDCLVSQDAVQIPALGRDFSVDGNLTDWAKIPVYIDDPGGDAPGAADIGAVSVATSGEDLAVAAVYQPASGISLNFEWGGLKASKGVASAQVRRLARLYAGQLQIFQDGQWQTVPATEGQAATGSGGTEVLFSRRLLGDVVTWPTWWLRVFTRDESAGRVMDSTAAVYFPSVLVEDNPQFIVNHCDQWVDGRVPFHFVEVRDARNVDGTNRAFQLVRATFNIAEGILGNQPLPLTRLSVIGSDDAWDTADIVGIGPDYYGSADPYRALDLNLKPFNSKSWDAFPEGVVVKNTAATIFDLYLQSAYPSAPIYLSTVVRDALLDHLVIQAIGMSYFLDYFRDGVEKFLQASDVANPIPIGARGLSAAAAAAKQVGFGHLLSANFAPKVLLQAWKSAADRSKADPSVNPVTAFANALGEASGGTDKAHAKVTALWNGWMNGNNYDPQNLPKTLDDDDLDGLPNYLEAKFGSDPKVADTDRDGWSDAAEVILGTDPTSAQDHPTVLAPDSDFSDWQQLMPKRLIADQNAKSDTCPKQAYVDFHAALANHDQMLIGAVAQDFWDNDPNARWEVALDFTKDKRQLLVAAVSGSRQFEVDNAVNGQALKIYQRAAPVARRSFEVAISRQAFGLATNLDDADAVRIRLRTIYRDNGKDLLCDETSWFQPYVVAN